MYVNASLNIFEDERWTKFVGKTKGILLHNADTVSMRHFTVKSEHWFIPG